MQACWPKIWDYASSIVTVFINELIFVDDFSTHQVHCGCNPLHTSLDLTQFNLVGLPDKPASVCTERGWATNQDFPASKLASAKNSLGGHTYEVLYKLWTHNTSAEYSCDLAYRCTPISTESVSLVSIIHELEGRGFIFFCSYFGSLKNLGGGGGGRTLSLT